MDELFEIDMREGLLEPYFEDVFVGYATQRIVMDELPVVRVRTGKLDVDVPKWHYEPCKVPQYRQELRWREKS